MLRNLVHDEEEPGDFDASLGRTRTGSVLDDALPKMMMRYIKQYNKTAKPFRWASRRSDEAHRTIAVQVVRTVH